MKGREKGKKSGKS